ncbi:MAG: 3-phosphoserine/phosphohydroxythreonine transaminase [Planctomycetia bacterium]|nr:3-phosphoserine/phosphohydroxythreonine transaminase [Planctomycetia bacterium]
MKTVHNFNAGPAMLPPPVLERVQAELRDYRGHGMSIMEFSHRSKEFEAVNNEAETRLKRLLGVGDGWRAIFIQGGASLQFAMLPMNFLPPDGSADYLVTGSWGEKAVEEAKGYGSVQVTSTGPKFDCLPERVSASPSPAYIHLTTNETIQGVQWAHLPDVGSTPLVADMSSDILSRPFDTSRLSLIYAGAQKNLGPSGVTVVVLREELLTKGNKNVPTMLRYTTHVKNASLYNTPPTFAVYVLNLVLSWIEENGGADGMGRRNEAKAKMLYDVIDTGYYVGHAKPECRSRMNVTFRLPDEAAEKKFLSEASASGMVGLAGHRSVGGVRASIYNAVSPESCAVLAELMRDFARRNG